MLTLSKLTFSTNNFQSIAIKSFSVIGASFIFIGTATESVSAISLIGNNTGTNPGISTGSTNLNVIDVNTALGIQFTTPNTIPLGYQLNFITLKLANFKTSGSIGTANKDSFNLSILDNTSNLNPTGAALLSLSSSNLGISSGGNNVRDVKVTPVSNFIFAPTTTYWILLEASDATTTFNWVSNSNTSIPPGDGNTYSNISPTGSLGNVGAVKYRSYDDNTVSFSNASEFSTFNVDVTPVPFEFEPMAGLLVLGGLWGLNKLRNRKKDTSN